MKNKTAYLFSADIVRVMAIICVVIIHTFNAVQARIDFLGGTSWWIANFLGSVSRVSIPLFIMLSGFLIMGKNESFAKTLQRTYRRLIIPLLAWTVFYLLWNAGSPSFKGLATFFPRLFSGGAFHLYFLFILAGLYCFAPFLRSFLTVEQKVKKILLFFFLSIGFLFTLGQYSFNKCGDTNAFTLWIPYLGYFFGGYVLGNIKTSNSLKKLSFLAFTGGFAITAIFSFIHLYLRRENLGSLQPESCISPYFDNYLSFNVVLMSFAVFFLLFHFNFGFAGNLTIKKIVHSLSRASFGIYSIHIFVIEVIERTLNLRIETLQIGLLSYLFLKWFFVFGISYFLTLLGMQTPFLKKAFGVWEKK